jgi:hypothetical protein
MRHRCGLPNPNETCDVPDGGAGAAPLGRTAPHYT